MLDLDYGTHHGSVESTVEWTGTGWRIKCAACPRLSTEAWPNQDDALWLAWSHHKHVHPRSVMTFELLS